MKTLLWLDDLRDPFIVREWLYKFAPEFLYDGDVIWVKTYNEFVNWITEFGLPTKIAFDNDLGEELEGYGAAKWLSNYCIENNILFNSDYVIQSANNVAPEYIISTLENLKKYQRMNDNLVYDAMGDTVVIGDAYGYSQSKNGITRTIIGTCISVKNGKIQMTDITEKKYLYVGEGAQTPINVKTSQNTRTVSSVICFKVKL